MSDMSGMTGISGVVSQVTNALTTLDPQQGASAIEQVLGALKNVPGTETIQSTLTSLHGQLAGGSPNGAQVGDSLRDLSSQTRNVASKRRIRTLHYVNR